VARGIAAKPYKEPVDRLPQELRDLDYDALRDIRFKNDDALWRSEKLPFELMFLHMGRGLREPVAIHTIDQGQVRPVKFDPGQFTYGRNKIDPQKLRDIGFAGFRVHYPVNGPTYKDEILVFRRCELFPRARQEPDLRPVGARPGGRHGGAGRRGVSALLGVLGREAEARRQRVDDLRAARVAPPHRGLPVRRDTGCRHRRCR
jgi:hypothetical protein